MSPARELAIGLVVIIAGCLSQISVDVKPYLGTDGGHFVAIIRTFETLCPPFFEVRTNQVSSSPWSNGFEVSLRELDDGGNILQYTLDKVFSSYIV